MFSLRLLFSRAVLMALAIAGVLASLGGDARADDVGVDLYTIGPAATFSSRFGHSLLCVGGTCYDYGIPDRPELLHMAWTASRGIPSFVPVALPEDDVVAFYKEENRQIELQRIALAPDETARLRAALEEDVRTRRAYAYHPYRANCTTQLRDHLDRATNGRLRAGPREPPKGTFREYAEEGNSGRAELLTPMALYLGEESDRTPTPWEAMFLPAVLRDGVDDRLGAAPTTLNERLAITLQTSRVVGRIVLALFAFLLFGAARLAIRRGRLGFALKLVGGCLGAVALSVDLVSALVAWPEVSRNWALLLFLPTDLALPWLRGRTLTLYLRVRLVMAALFAGLEITGIAHQPLLPLVLLVALPLAGLHSAVRRRAEDAERAASALAV
jgi:hypothetical protein